jgi:subtilisin family serine protease
MTNAGPALNHPRYLQRQIEYIRDTDNSDIREVIVKMGTPGPEDPPFMQKLGEAIRRRGVSTSARDVLPVAKDFQNAKDRRARTLAARERELTSADRSLAATAAQSAWTAADIAELKQSALADLQPLLGSSIVQQALATATGETPSSAQPTRLWISNSVVLPVPDRFLPELITNVPNIEDIYPNRRLSVPPIVKPTQIAYDIDHNKASAWGVRAIGALSAWGAYDCRGEDVIVGLLDTGVDADHPDLKGKVVAWAEFDEKGVQVPDSRPHDSDQHGTHCAGIILGERASGRWIGIAPRAKMAAAMVLNGERGGTDAQVLAGLQWTIEQQVDVINVSLGSLVLGPDAPSTYTKAFLSALKVGIPVVTAIGNDGSQTSGSPGNDFLGLAVGATDYLNRAAGFSGGGTYIIRQSSYFPPAMLPLVFSKPDLSAPGVSVWSSVPGNGWTYFNGTSMAAPHVAGAIALLLSATTIKDLVNPHERAFLIQDLLIGSAEESGEAGQNHRFGFGRIDILKAIGFAYDRGYGREHNGR